MNEEIMNTEEKTRKNPFCVIAKEPWENGGRDLQSNHAWSKNPYGDTYAVVPDEMVNEIIDTMGFCDIVLNEDGTEVVSFTAREIPDFPKEEPVPTQLDRVEAQVTYTAMMTDTLIV